ncbi:hypothetical protein E4T56_gene8905 [Termitomyces sp. T112]|nr:hypothetical protein E4T56_gene8905 [Termitomyces sp. T112]
MPRKIDVLGIVLLACAQTAETLYRWDSAEVGITFEKPTGLAAQLQKFEHSMPELLEFDRLKEHLRAASLSSSTITASAVAPSSAAHSHHLYSTSITAAASAALARDIPGVTVLETL